MLIALAAAALVAVRVAVVAMPGDGRKLNDWQGEEERRTATRVCATNPVAAAATVVEVDDDADRLLRDDAVDTVMVSYPIRR